MKILIFLTLFSLTTAFAGSCTPELEAIFLDEASEIRPTGVAANHDRWTLLEKLMIREAVESQGYYQDLSLSEAVDIFADKNEWSDGLPGHNAGQIFYYQLNGKILAKVVYYPGENEYGSIFEVRDHSYTFLTSVHDGDISCDWE